MGCSGSRSLPKDDEFEIQRLITKKSQDEYFLMMNKKYDFEAIKKDHSKLLEVGQSLSNLKTSYEKYDEDMKKLEEILKKHLEAKDKLIKHKEKIIQDMKRNSELKQKKFVEDTKKHFTSIGVETKELKIDEIFKN